MSNLEGIQFYADPTLEDIILYNLISFISYGLLEVGGYYNISLGQQNYLGQDESKLYPVSGQGITPYTIYRDRKNDWVWESGVSLKYSSGTQPLSITGISVNGTIYATGSTITGTGFYVDYNRGQVVFNNPLSSSHTVKVPHTLRAITVDSSESNNYRHLISDWAKNAFSSGYINDISYKTYMPAMLLKMSNLRTDKGLQLGSRAKITLFSLQFDMYATNAYELRKMTNFVYFLETKCVRLFDYKNAPKPLNYRGEVVNPTGTWPNLVQNFPLGEARFREDCQITKIDNIEFPYLQARARISLEFDSYPS